MKFITTLRQNLFTFFTYPVSPVPLGIFRILIAVFILLEGFLWYKDWLAFFGPDAWIQWEISRATIPKLSIHISEVAKFLSLFGFTEEQSVILFFWIYVCSAFGLLIGLFTRFWAILTWFCHYVLMLSMDVYIYGVDVFLQIALFYIMIMPVAKFFSLDAKFKWIKTETTWWVTLSLRVLQIHICLAYLSSGYEKILSSDWWNGNVIWHSLVHPDFRQYDLTWVTNKSWLLILFSLVTIIIETGYCIAMWIAGVRVFWLSAIILLHLSIGIFLGLWLFSLIMIFLSLSAFGYDAWKDIKRWQQRKNAVDYKVQKLII